MYKLRELERKDLPLINNWKSDHNLISCLDAPYRYMNMDIDSGWLENLLSNRGNAIRCVIVDKEEDNILGMTSLVEIDFMNQSAKFHALLKDKNSQEIEAFAVKEMLNHAFYNMKLHRIQLEVLSSHNAVSIYEKAGFIKEGVKREALFEKDAFADIYVYSLLKEDYKSKYKYSEAEIVNFCITQITVKSEQEMILRYFKDAFSFDITEPEIFDSLSGKIHCNADFFMAYANGVLGYAAIYANNLENRTAYITLIAVEQNERRRGVGTALLHACIDAAKEKNMKFLKLEVLNDNKEAIKFYIKNGFNYYGGCSEKSMYMIKEIE